MASNNVQHYQQQQQQQQQANSTPYQCKECGLYLNSAESLEVHLQYHKENLLNKWANQATTAPPPPPPGDETNNNTKIKREFLPNNPDSSDSTMKNTPEYGNGSPVENNPAFGQPPTPQSYHSAGSSPYQNPESSSFSPGFQNYQIKQEQISPQHYPSSSSSSVQQQQQQQQQAPHFYSDAFFNLDSQPYNQEYSTKIASQNSAFRYHPYQYDRSNSQSSQVSSSSPVYLAQPTPSPSPKQCDKCGYVCESAAQLTEHINVTHPPTPANHHHGNYQNYNMFSGCEIIKTEGEQQSEILDLDSHKVHQVFTEEEKRQGAEMIGQNPHSVSAMLNQWSPEHAQQPKMFQDPRMYMTSEKGMFPNGGMIDQKLFQTGQAQSDFIPNGLNADNGMNPGYRAFDIPPQAPNAILSGNQPGPTQPAPASSKGTNWKSNEARRPKTYNCTACNKWFTSSGHLKRHYNTTLHKNAVKSSGQPDPATLPISTHHHPSRSDQNNRGEDQSSNSPREDSRTEQDQSQNFERTPMMQQSPGGPYDRPSGPGIHHPIGLHHPTGLSNLSGSPPNGEAGPSVIDSRGLLSLNTMANTNSTLATNTNSSGFLPPMVMPMEAATQYQMYPNGDAPHVSPVIITNSHSTTGEDHVREYHAHLTDIGGAEEAQPLPSFSQIQGHRYGHMGNYQADVGGTGSVTAPYSFYSNPFNQTKRYNQHDNNNSSKLAVLTPADPTSIEGDMYPLAPVNNNNLIIATDGQLRPEVKYEMSNFPPESARTSAELEENNPQISSTSNVSKPQPLHKCFDCDKVFNKSCYLTQHNKTFHSGDKPFKCARCGKRFSCEQQHLEHQSKHAGDKPHKCDQCPKQFNHKTDLRRHMCLHTGQKPFVCELCGKGFIRKDHMVKHGETHLKKPHSKTSSASSAISVADQ